MNRTAKSLILPAVLLLVPVTVEAQQATITGVVKDVSGAVLPGVTVEASSPILIEKARNAVTDGTGQYRIVSLPSGTYTITFTLPVPQRRSQPVDDGFRSLDAAGPDGIRGRVPAGLLDVGPRDHSGRRMVIITKEPA